MTTLTPIREVYPDLHEDFSYGPGDYDPLLASLGTIALQKDLGDDYHGDSYVLYRDGGRWGYLTFGWGSCSGCDELQGASSWKELEALRDRLLGDITWQGSALEMLRWLVSRDWRGLHSWSAEAQRTFLVEATALLAPEAFSAEDDE